MTTTTTSTPLRQPSMRRWVWACAVAETVGMTAAATAAMVATTLTDRGRAAWLALAVVVAGGLVEGTALGVLQARALRPWLDAQRRRRWALATVLVAGVGWAAASAPAALADPDDGASAQPPLALVLLGAAALGVLMGAALGAVQAWALRGAVRHPWRWVGASAAGWAPAMAVIFAGATAPDAQLSLIATVLLGATTGVLAGLVLGLVTGWFLPSLTGLPASGRVVLALLGSPAHAAAPRTLLGLRVTGAVTGRRHELPVQYAPGPDGLVVVPGHPERKRWWRNLAAHPDVWVLLDGRWQPGFAAVLEAGDPGRRRALAAYRARYPRVRLPADQPVVVVSLSG